MSELSDSELRVSLAETREQLARFRTALSLDRTTLSWVRTTLTMGSFGFGMIGFFRTIEGHAQTPQAARLHRLAIFYGECLVIAGIAATVLAVISHWHSLRQMERGETPNAARWPRSITIALFVALLGAVGMWTLIVRR